MVDGNGASAHCDRCGKPLLADWAACPYCGRPIEGAAKNERLVRIVGKLGTTISETALTHYAKDATKHGEPEKAEQLEMIRKTIHDVTPLVVDAIAEYLSESRQAAERRRRSEGGRGSPGRPEGPSRA